jgi:hypothetical protein
MGKPGIEAGFSFDGARFRPKISMAGMGNSATIEKADRRIRVFDCWSHGERKRLPTAPPGPPERNFP